MKYKLSNGLEYGEGPDGKRVCRGAQLGRPDSIPSAILSLPSVKLHLVKLEWVDQNYDQGGSYWGNSGDNIYCAWANVVNPQTGNFFPFLQVFVRAHSRKEAKGLVLEKVPSAKFFR